jgi:hypothetical protein
LNNDVLFSESFTPDGSGALKYSFQQPQKLLPGTATE